MSAPDTTELEVEAVSAVIRSGVLSMGPQQLCFEESFAAYIGAPHAVAVNSGTSGLHLSMIGAGVRSGDLIITSPFSFIATANAPLYENAIPIFVDSDPATGNLDPLQVAAAADDLRRGGKHARRWLPPTMRGSRLKGRLKAILPVHIYGQPADMDPVLETARRHDLAVIEDACEALGSAYKGHKVGTFGQSAVFGFYPNKQITTGEGGMIVTADAALADLYRSLRNQGRENTPDGVAYTRIGYNYRLDEMSAALGAVQMARIVELLAKRCRVMSLYDERLEGLQLIGHPQLVPTTTTLSPFVYVVRLEAPLDRATVMAALAAAEIESRVYFEPIHLSAAYRDRFAYVPGAFPVAEQLGATSLALPFFSRMTEDQVDQVCEVLRRAVIRTTSD